MRMPVNVNDPFPVTAPTLTRFPAPSPECPALAGAPGFWLNGQHVLTEAETHG